MGGIDSMRGWLPGHVDPAGLRRQVSSDTFGKPASDPYKFTPGEVAVRGGNLMSSIRGSSSESRSTTPFETVVFFDTGNIWVDAAYPLARARRCKRAFLSPSAPRSAPGSACRPPIGPVVFDYGINLSRLVSGSNRSTSMPPRTSARSVGHRSLLKYRHRRGAPR